MVPIFLVNASTLPATLVKAAAEASGADTALVVAGGDVGPAFAPPEAVVPRQVLVARSPVPSSIGGPERAAPPRPRPDRRAPPPRPPAANRAMRPRRRP